MAGTSITTQSPKLSQQRSRRQENGLQQERFSATYANTNPNFVFQNIPDKITDDSKLLAILQVIDNILCRGTMTPPSDFLCRNYLENVLADDSDDVRIDFAKWNKWRQEISERRINTYSRDIPRWEKTIRGGNGINGNAAYRFYHDLLPEWFEKTPVVQLMRPEVRFDEISQNAIDSNFLESEVDFYLEQARLVIEIDGEQHKQQQMKDAGRSRFLRQAGCKEIRIPTSAFSDVQALEGYRRRIQNEIDKSGLVEKYKGYAKLAKHKEEYQQRKNLDIILRFELLFISLIKHAKLRMDADNWKLYLQDGDLQPLCWAAYDDIQLWFENIAGMCGYPIQLPFLEFCSYAEADAAIDFEYNKCWTDEALAQQICRSVHVEFFHRYALQRGGGQAAVPRIMFTAFSALVDALTMKRLSLRRTCSQLWIYAALLRKLSGVSRPAWLTRAVAPISAISSSLE